jgi:hypothetical protein
MKEHVTTFDEFLKEHADYELRRFEHANRLIESGQPRNDVVRVIFPDHPEYLSEDKK